LISNAQRRNLAERRTRLAEEAGARQREMHDQRMAAAAGALTSALFGDESVDEGLGGAGAARGSRGTRGAAPAAAPGRDDLRSAAAAVDAIGRAEQAIQAADAARAAEQGRGPVAALTSALGGATRRAAELGGVDMAAREALGSMLVPDPDIMEGAPAYGRGGAGRSREHAALLQAAEGGRLDLGTDDGVGQAFGTFEKPQGALVPGRAPTSPDSFGGMLNPAAAALGLDPSTVVDPGALATAVEAYRRGNPAALRAISRRIGRDDLTADALDGLAADVNLFNFRAREHLRGLAAAEQRSVEDAQDFTDTFIQFLPRVGLTDEEASEFAPELAKLYTADPKNAGKMLDALSTLASKGIDLEVAKVGKKPTVRYTYQKGDELDRQMRTINSRLSDVNDSLDALRRNPPKRPKYREGYQDQIDSLEAEKSLYQTQLDTLVTTGKYIPLDVVRRESGTPAPGRAFSLTSEVNRIQAEFSSREEQAGEVRRMFNAGEISKKQADELVVAFKRRGADNTAQVRN
jgi:hypothetical protein